MDEPTAIHEPTLTDEPTAIHEPTLTDDLRLTDEAWATLRAAIDRVIPTDDYPSATANGVDVYLARQLATDLAPMLIIYRAGLAGLEAEALAAHELGFAQIADAERDAILDRAERGTVVAPWKTPPSRFVALLAEHTIEGYYADPSNGGNAALASWRMLGFEVTA